MSLQEHLKILYYYPEEEILNRKVRNIGLCEALVNFTKTFNPERPCQAVHTDRKRQVFSEPEPDIWMVLVGSCACMRRKIFNMCMMIGPLPLSLLHKTLRSLVFPILLPQTVSIPWGEVVNNGERSVHYSTDHVQVRPLRMYC